MFAIGRRLIASGVAPGTSRDDAVLRHDSTPTEFNGAILRRIARAYDSSGQDMLYTYDERDRLIRAAGSNGIVRRYDYDAPAI